MDPLFSRIYSIDTLLYPYALPIPHFPYPFSSLCLSCNLSSSLRSLHNGFDGREFSSFNLVHQLPGTATLIRNFLDFVVKEESLGVFDDLLEFLPILETS